MIVGNVRLFCFILFFLSFRLGPIVSSNGDRFVIFEFDFFAIFCWLGH